MDGLALWLEQVPVRFLVPLLELKPTCKCMADAPEDAGSSKPSKASEKDTWEVLESISKIIAALGIPVVLGVGGWIIQGTVSQQTVSKDYVLLATDILKTKREAGDDGGLRKWAVDLLNHTSPVKLDDTTAQQLIKGTITIPSPISLSRIGGTDILGVNSAIAYESEMLVAAEGSPHAFHPDDKSGLDFLGDAGQPGNWIELVTDNGQRTGKPIIQTENDPAPGFYVSSTVLQDPSRDRKDPRRYVNSEAVNYIVVPGRLNAKLGDQGIQIGDLAVVIRPETGAHACAIVADTGPPGHIGEGSIALANAIGIPSNVRSGGVSHGIVYVVFPGSGQGRPL
jgi:hypothetical protein